MADDAVSKVEAVAEKVKEKVDHAAAKAHGTLSSSKKKLQQHDLYQRAIDKAFLSADYDNNGTISGSELHAGILLVYDKINKLAPCHIKPPKAKEIKAVMKKHDVSNDGKLSKAEFSSCVLDVLAGSTDSWHKSIWFRVISSVALKLAIFPAAGYGLKKGLDAVGFEAINKVPTAVLAFGCESAYKVAAMLVAPADD